MAFDRTSRDGSTDRSPTCCLENNHKQQHTYIDNTFHIIHFENLINEFGKKSGIYGLLNTSFNFHGKPLVNNLNDAINVFIKTDLDALLVNNYILIKKNLIRN